MGGALHGTFVIAKSGGGFQTISTQRGTVKAVSSTSITVVSQDKFTQTYVVTADTNVNAARDGIGSVSVGESVGVMATVSGSTSTAVEIRDKTDLDKNRKQFAPPASGPTA